MLKPLVVRPGGSTRTITVVITGVISLAGIPTFAAGDQYAVAVALAELEASRELYESNAHKGMMLQSRAELALAANDENSATATIRQAINAWEQAGSPLYAAITRLRLAQVLIDANVVHSAALELRSAGNVLHQPGARALKECSEELLRRITRG